MGISFNNIHPAYIHIHNYRYTDINIHPASIDILEYMRDYIVNKMFYSKIKKIDNYI